MKRISLNNMSGSDSRTFAEELAESSGHVRIFIHPAAYPLQQVGMEPLGFLKKIITAPSLKKTPIIIFQDRDTQWDFDRFLKDITLSRNIYLVKTKDEDPEPKEGWDSCIELFHRLGIKKIVIGGSYLYEYKEPLIGKGRIEIEEPTVRGCVHGAGIELSRKFEITISHFVNPGPSLVYKRYCGKFSPADHSKKMQET